MDVAPSCTNPTSAKSCLNQMASFVQWVTFLTTNLPTVSNVENSRMSWLWKSMASSTSILNWQPSPTDLLHSLKLSRHNLSLFNLSGTCTVHSYKINSQKTRIFTTVVSRFFFGSLSLPHASVIDPTSYIMDLNSGTANLHSQWDCDMGQRS